MRIKPIIILGLTIMLISCGQNANKSEAISVGSREVEDKKTDNKMINSSKRTQPVINISPNQKEINEALSDPKIDDYYKEIYKKEELVSAEDSKMLSITEKLFTENPSQDLFYFIVFTKSMNGADGFYSEAVAESAFKFVTTKTVQFADYFNIAPSLTDEDLTNWAEFVSGEIKISKEGNEGNATKELENKLLVNLAGSRKEYLVVIEKFIEKVNSTMP